ncbi:hypothetical protein CC99x_008405 [Candidatus Berkiella cookevillensis]|uniref:Uncharacterized protein n=1 Tax=Candidatus Berkiella cookevillensis TaxID=437022 RepID=A0A0Q9YPR9_9GAMM|nr:hypothetical protein [Candidatus Berkiella cookevillensis]MCS5708920.1 hypothetical protein [Candidatus Berkiella cookevillensis]
MDTIIQVLIAAMCLFIVWRIYKVLKANPELLSKENMSKSFTTMGVLALILIGGIALMVMLLKAAS